jgi:tetratricopeptide (TPR) repeat protein
MREREAHEVERLLSDVEWAMAQQFPARDLLPMLKRLVQNAPAGSPAALFGKLRLSELTVTQKPWYAARLAREVLACGDDDRAWAVLGLAHTLLGNYHSAGKAYRKAIALCPDGAVYHHNLGHLLDMALDRPADALTYLQTACRLLPDESEVASSYAHALARVGQREQAKVVLKRALRLPAAEVDSLLDEWLAAHK